MCDGATIVASVRQLRTFCREVALLLRSADSLMSEQGWKSHPGLVYGALSYTLAEPHRWLQQDFFRLYRCDRLEHVLAYVSVIIDDVERLENVSEPLITAGYLVYPGKEGISSLLRSFDYSIPRWHLNMTSRSDDGILLTAGHQPTARAGFLKAATIGLPLLSIEGSTDLQHKILAPLLASLPPEEPDEDSRG